MAKRIKIKNRIIVTSAVICIIALLITAAIGIIKVSAAPEDPDYSYLSTPTGTLITLSSSNDLLKYAYEYYYGGHNPDDTLELSLTGGGESYFDLTSTEIHFDGNITVTDHAFEGIGTSARPFNGTIKMTETAQAPIVADRALFGCVTTNVTVVDATNNLQELNFIRKNNADAPLFADTVKHTASANAEWKVKISADTETSADSTTCSFAGVIGTIEADCVVDIEFTHDSVLGSAAAISSAGNVGAICGTLGDGAELTVKCSSTAPYTVTSTGGHAGGIVGEMGDASKIIFKENFASQSDVTASGSGKYAGGIVGHATNADIEFTGSATASLSKTVTGTAGAGGVYGYYKSTGSDRTFDLIKFYSDGLNVKNGYAGGIIGYLDAENSITVTDTGANISDNIFTKKANFTGGDYCGGIIGAYSNNDPENVLDISQVDVIATSSAGTRKGGILGGIIGDDEAYVKIGNVYASVSNMNAGLIASMGNNGSFVDIENTVKVKGGCGSGLIDWQNDGLVRIKGTTDLSEANYSSAQLIGTRGNGIVYALGSGSDANWTFKRSSGVSGGSAKVDDIGDWGEVLRLSGATGNGLTESTFFTVNDTTHKVAVASHTESIGTVSDFIKTALNIQSNNGDKGYLDFDSSSASDTVLGKPLTLTANIDLSDTGIESFTRDNGANGYYTGIFNGGGHTITLAIGEAYGLTNTGGAVSSGDNLAYGMIIKHQYQGLFAKINNATFNNLTVDGFDHTTATSGGNIGGIAAVAKGNVTLSGVVTKQENRVWAGTTGFNCGGAIGKIEDGSTGTISVSGCTFGSIMNDFRQSSNDGAHFGGCIGYVDATGSNTFNFNNVQIGLSGATASENNRLYQKNKTKDGKIYFGGLIGVFKEASTKADSNARKVNLTNITVNDGVEIQSKNISSGARGNSSGAFIGCVWPNVDVKIGDAGSDNGIFVGNGGSSAPKIEVMSGSNSGNIGALFYQATGKMDVHHVKVNGASITSGYGTSSFGFIVNDAVYGTKSALYLNVDLAKYDIAAANVSGSFNVFDEIAAYSVFSGKQTDDNGQAIISLNIPNNTAVIMNGSSCNTYQNQTSYATKINPNTRYYYNLEAIRKKSSPSSGEKLLLWSIKKYAHSSINASTLFSKGFDNEISGNCDMEGLSYYPVDASGMTINNATIKFYNNEIETGEAGTGNSDSSVRSTHIANRSQHYLMHEAIFRNYTGALTVNGLTVQGNVSNDTGKSGFIVRNMLGNTDNLDKVTVKNVVLDGAVVNGTGYAPLLINDIGKNVSLDMSTVSTKSGSYDTLISGGGYAASSLIGDVGYDTATNITLKFSDMILDSRTTALLSDTSLTGAYGTGRTIFSRATFLNNFAYANGGYAEYNYEHDEDYGSNTHHVTYAKEVSESVEYAGRENQYFNSDTNFTDPTTGSNTTGEYDFSSGFLPHVYNYDGQQITDNGQPAYNYFHEIRVNLKSAAMESGCGHYNDPYVIRDGNVLSTVAKIIAGNLDDTQKIILPDDLANKTNDAYEKAVYEIDMWCDFVNNSNAALQDRTYQYNGTNFVEIDDNGDPVPSGKTIDPDRVREYLAGAYYSIETDIELPADFVGLGAMKSGSSDAGYENKYAFRGVIIGHNHTLTNMSNQKNPLIKSANGCVVKDLTVSVGKDGGQVSIQISAASKLLFRYDNEGCMAYGAVIGQVMGGDNVIDHVGVDFSHTTFTNAGDTYVRLVPVGGYVGVIVNGGVIFRNMSSVDAASRTGLTMGSGKKITFANDAWLYVNPIIGRVISGYAFNEADSYAVSSAVLDNGTKNYSICDLNPNSSSKLTVNATAANNHTITIPDAQAFYVLSCIVNSGAGSAAYNASTEQPYASITITENKTTYESPWIAYRNYTSTRCANYSEVGSTAQITGDYASAHENDAYNGSTKIPYIIRQYTKSTKTVNNEEVADLFRARSICGNSGNSGNNKSVASVINLSSGVTYNLPAGYRGIGSIYSDNTALALHFNKLDGKNATVNLSMYYGEYDYDGNDDGSTRNNENYNEFANPGFGLFNVMHQIVNSDDDVIKDLTLTGNVVHEAIKRSSNAKTLVDGKMKEKNNAGVKSQRVLSVGGLAGYTARSFTLNNVSMNGLSVSSMKYGGGLVGHANNGVCTVLNCGTGNDGVSVDARVRAGGMIGYVNGANARVNISLTDDTVSFTIDEVRTTFLSATKTDYYSNNQWYFDYYSAGGLIGTVECGVTANVTKVNIQDVVVKGKANGTHNVYTTASILNHRDVAGGLIGSALLTDYSISGVQIINVDIQGDTSGGVVGYDAFNSGTSGPAHTITDTTVTGNGDTYVSAIRCAGGFIGKVSRLNDKSISKIDISGCAVESMTICSTWSAYTGYAYEDDCSAGTVIGGIRNEKGYSSGGVCEINVSDHKSENCTVYTLFSTANSQTTNTNCRESGTGGLVGSIGFDNNNNPVTFYGHNILLNNVSVRNYNKTLTTGNLVSNARTTGYVCGNNFTDSKIKITGLSFTGDSVSEISYISGKMAADANTNYFGTDGYVVMADHDGISAGITPNTANPTLVTDADDYTSAPESPYVTVNPSGYIGTAGLFLTSDGISSTADGLPIHEILTGDARYGVASSYASVFNTYKGKLSTYNTEQSENRAYDFAVLVTDDVSKVKTTDMVNAYINLLANTNYDYTYNNDVYTVNIYKMVYSGGSFIISMDGADPEKANLKRDTTNHRFYIEPTDQTKVDTSGSMFTLIDIAYKDPADTSKIAYHLYVPVIVKKILTYDFHIAVDSATGYLSSEYESRYGKPLMENLGTPVTLYFKYTYMRTQNEWQLAVESGENLLDNYNKNLNLQRIGKRPANIGNYPDGTLMTLVDVNRGGKPYYASFEQAYQSTTNNIALAAFKEDMDLSNGEGTGTAAFSPIFLNDLLKISAKRDTDGNMVLVTGATDDNPLGATVKTTVRPDGTYEAEGTYFRPVNESTDSEAVKYKVTVEDVDVPEDANDVHSISYVPIDEEYYVSIFTEAITSNAVYHYTIGTTTKFDNNAVPSRIRNATAEATSVHLILGNIFVQSNYTVLASPSDGSLIPMSFTTNRHTLTVDMSTKITLATEVKDEVESYLGNPEIKVFHSFMTILTRTDESGNRRVIDGLDTAGTSAQYQIADAYISDFSTLTPGTYIVNDNNIEIKSADQTTLNAKLRNTNGAFIMARIVMNYSNEDDIAKQFPNREKIENTTIGTVVSGTSNIAFSYENTAYSKSTVAAQDTNATNGGYSSYFSKISDKAQLYFNVKSTVFEGDYGPLGINPLDTNGLTDILVSTRALYDITKIKDKIADYNYVELTLTLHSKVDNYNDNNPLEFPTYMDPDQIYVNGYTVGDDYSEDKESSDTTYVFILKKSAVIPNSPSQYNLEFPIEFTIFTGSKFEAKNLTYSNYKIKLTAKLFKYGENNSKDYLNESEAKNEIVYTNARIWPDFID